MVFIEGVGGGGMKHRFSFYLFFVRGIMQRERSCSLALSNGIHPADGGEGDTGVAGFIFLLFFLLLHFNTWGLFLKTFLTLLLLLLLQSRNATFLLLFFLLLLLHGYHLLKVWFSECNTPPSFLAFCPSDELSKLSSFVHT